MNVLPKSKQIQVISALTEGVSIRATERLTAVHRDTMTLTQIGLLADILGFIVIAIPSLFWRRKGIPNLPKMGDWRWGVYVLGVAMVIVGFFMQLLGASDWG